MTTNKTLLDIAPIRTEIEYELALSEIERLLDVGSGTPEADYLQVLSILVEAYEEDKYPISAPDPIAAILFRMESLGLSRKDLEPIIGSRGRVSEIINKKRPLTIGMIRNLESELGIPADVLIQPYSLIEEDEVSRSIHRNIYFHYFEWDSDQILNADFVRETKYALDRSVSDECYYRADWASSSSPINVRTYGVSFSNDENESIPFKHQEYIDKSFHRGEKLCLGDLWIDTAGKSSTLVEIAL